MRKKLILLLFLGLTFITVGMADTYALDIFDRSSGVQQMGLGYAGTARVNNTAALHWNPAGLAFASQPSVELTAYKDLEVVDNLSLDTQYLSPKTIPLGFSYTSQTISDIPLTSDQGSTPYYLGDYSDKYTAIGLGVAQKLDPNLAVGATYKYLNRTIYTYTAAGYGIDVGLIRKLSKSTNFGLTFRNLASQVNWSTGFSEKLERKVVLGLSSVDYFLRNKVMLDLDYEINPDLPEKNSWYFGSEWWLLSNTFAFRLGTNINKDVTCGLGFRLNDFKLDFAYIMRDPTTQFKNAILFSSGFNFKSVGTSETTPEVNESAKEINNNVTPDLSGSHKVLDDVIDQIVTSNQQVVIKFSGAERINQVAIVNPSKEVSYFVPTEKGLVIFPRTAVGEHLIYIQYKDEKIVKKRITL